MTDGAVRVGVLSLHNSKETKAILNAVDALGHDPVWVSEESLSLRAGTETRVDPPVDVLVNRLLLSKSDAPLADLGVATLFGPDVPLLNPPDAVLRTVYKPAAMRLLADAGVPIPETAQPFGDDAAVPGDEMVRKPVVGTNGHGVTRASDQPVPPSRRGRTLHQAFVASDGTHSDVRVYVVGDEVVGAMRRHAPPDDWRTNVALGGRVEDVTAALPARIRSVARDATAALGLDYAGVDVVGTPDDPRVLEVNATAGFKGLFEATGRSAAPAIASLAVETAGESVPDAAEASLASTLADERPACAPDRDDGTGGRVGYTERVAVAGGEDVESVVAKADTGAERTTIDTALAGRVGAGPITGTTSVRSGTLKASSARPLVDVELRVAGDWHAVTAGVTDREHMDYPVLLGRDVLAEYAVDVATRVEDDREE